MANDSENTELLISNLKEENQQLKKDNEELRNILLNGKADLWRFEQFEHANPEIIIRTLTGGKIPISINRSYTVMDIKKALERERGIPATMQRLIFGRTQLLNHRSLLHYKITNGSTIHFVSKIGRPDVEKTHNVDERRNIALDNFEYQELRRKQTQKTQQEAYFQNIGRNNSIENALAEKIYNKFNKLY